jgi:hypothetical protein
MEVQVLKSFTAYDRKLFPGEVVDAGAWNIGRVQKLINQRFIVPIKIADGKIEVSPTLDPIPKAVATPIAPPTEPHPQEIEPPAKKLPNISPEERAARSIRMKKMWEKRRAAEDEKENV